MPSFCQHRRNIHWKPLKLTAVSMGMAVSESITAFMNNSLREYRQPLVHAGSCTFLWCEKIYLALVLYSCVMEREKVFEAAVSSVILYESVGWLEVPLTSIETLYCTVCGRGDDSAQILREELNTWAVCQRPVFDYLHQWGCVFTGVHSCVCWFCQQHYTKSI